MKQFDARGLLTAFLSRGLGPAAIINVVSIPQPIPPANHAEIAATLAALQGDWRTDEEAEQRLDLHIMAHKLRLHTVTPGLRITASHTIWEAGPEKLRFGKTAATAVDMTWKKEGESCLVSIPFPSAFQGEFKVFRGAK